VCHQKYLFILRYVFLVERGSREIRQLRIFFGAFAHCPGSHRHYIVAAGHRLSTRYSQAIKKNFDIAGSRYEISIVKLILSISN